MAATRSQSLSFLTRSVTVKPMPLGSDTKKTVIFEAELIASVAAIILWRDRIVNSSLVAFVDNNSVRDVCISGKVRNAIGHKLITLLLAAEDPAGLNTWIARVPSPSNPPDILSREDTKEIF